ncbi:MAG: hypothetical protein DRP72_01605 [Candidatus Omnitrophota bacterium]|nr:MAG: hypothetical protein DRP72_01605 [Candidatus Omnitrophota bacterium]
MKKREREVSRGFFSKKVWMYILAIVAFVIVILGIRSFFYREGRIKEVKLFQVKEVKVKPQETRFLKDIERLVRGKSLLFLNLEMIRQHLLHFYPEIKEVKIVKKFPHLLLFEIETRVPFFQVKCGDTFYTVDNQFRIITKEGVASKSLIIVDIGSCPSKLAEGEVIQDQKVRKAGQLIKILKNFNLGKVDIIVAKDLGSLSLICNDTRIVLGSSDFQKKLKLLTLLLKDRFNNTLSSLRYIDLRYDKVFIKKR